MKIAVLGTGRVGGTLGKRWAQGGHEVFFGSRDPRSEKVAQLLAASGTHARAGTHREAVEASDLVVYAAPWPAAPTVLGEVTSWTGRILVDCTNPLTSDFSGLDLGFTTSAAERIAEWARGARVIKAFNNVSSAIMNNPRFGDDRATMFYCGDDRPAKEVVRQLASELDFDPVDAGPLKIARYLEPFAMLYIQLAVKEGWGSHCAFRMMKR